MVAGAYGGLTAFRDRRRGWFLLARRARPTGRTIFQALADLRLIPAHDGNPATIPKPADVQAGYWTSSASISADPDGSSSEIPCAKNRSRVSMMMSRCSGLMVSMLCRSM